MDELDRFPRVELGAWPTPVRHLPNVSDHLGVDVWAKLEEDCGVWGGNKIRKLEHIFAAARAEGHRSLVTWGAGSSNWAAAVALHGPHHGFRVTVGLGGLIPDDYRRLYTAMGTKLVRMPRLVLAPVALAVARPMAGLRARILPVGGSGTEGDIGSVRAGAEIGTAVDDGDLPRPQGVFVATGSSGTAAGLIVGLGMARVPVRVHAAKVSPWPYATARKVTHRIISILRRLEAGGVRNVIPAPWLLDRDQLGPGYGKPTTASRAAIELAAADGLVLDPTYGAKAFAALIATASRQRKGPYLFVHTSPTRPVPIPGND